MSNPEFYNQLAAAMRKREKCLNAIGRWQEDLASTEQEIADLMGSQLTETPGVAKKTEDEVQASFAANASLAPSFAADSSLAN